ncbi:hypothetical protein KQX54_017550 [Cotesia glomerata]|uniref:Uncharacterized protein n=1 Tax=Cotesia glomerata TaxID=32391 RepID=A0AAV7HY57_COTGL|nr:hypothetical protein KQX54_017550 [Cotesia glomerata]
MRVETASSFARIPPTLGQESAIFTVLTYLESLPSVAISESVPTHKDSLVNTTPFDGKSDHRAHNATCYFTRQIPE